MPACTPGLRRKKGILPHLHLGKVNLTYYFLLAEHLHREYIFIVQSAFIQLSLPFRPIMTPFTRSSLFFWILSRKC